jgi:hypothetical protein
MIIDILILLSGMAIMYVWLEADKIDKLMTKEKANTVNVLCRKCGVMSKFKYNEPFECKDCIYE